MQEIAPWLPGIAITLGLAGIAAWWRTVTFILDLNKQQDLNRHALRGDVHVLFSEVEERLTERIARLEALRFDETARNRRHGDDD